MKHLRLSLKTIAPDLMNQFHLRRLNAVQWVQTAQRIDGTSIPASIITLKTILSLAKSFKTFIKFPRLSLVTNFQIISINSPILETAQNTFYEMKNSNSMNRHVAEIFNGFQIFEQFELCKSVINMSGGNAIILGTVRVKISNELNYTR